MLKYGREYTLGLNTFTFEGLEIVFWIYLLDVYSFHYLIVKTKLERVFYGGIYG